MFYGPICVSVPVRSHSASLDIHVCECCKKSFLIFSSKQKGRKCCIMCALSIWSVNRMLCLFVSLFCDQFVDLESVTCNVTSASEFYTLSKVQQEKRNGTTVFHQFRLKTSNPMGKKVLQHAETTFCHHDKNINNCERSHVKFNVIKMLLINTIYIWKVTDHNTLEFWTQNW